MVEAQKPGVSWLARAGWWAVARSTPDYELTMWARSSSRRLCHYAMEEELLGKWL